MGAGNNVTVNTGATVTASGNVQLIAGSSALSGCRPAGAVTVTGAVTSPGSVVLNAGTGGITLNGTVAATAAIMLSSTGAVTQTGGALQAATLTGTATAVSLPSTTNAISAVSFTTGTGGFALTDRSGLGVVSYGGLNGIQVPSTQTISLTVDALSVASGGNGVTMLSVNILALQTLTAGRDILISTGGTPSRALTVTTTELNRTNVSTLSLGAGGTSAIAFGQAANDSVNITSNLATPTTGTITVNGALNNSAGPTSSLVGGGNVVAASGGAGSAIGTVILGAGSSSGGVDLQTFGRVTLTSAGGVVGSPKVSSFTAGTGRHRAVGPGVRRQLRSCRSAAPGR